MFEIYFIILILIQLVHHSCAIISPDYAGPEPPLVKLVEAKFHTKDILRKPSFDDSNLWYFLPATFQSLKFTCHANYPTFWKFETPPHDHHFTVTKLREIDSYFNASTYKFSSNLTLHFKDPYFVPTIFCTRVISAGAKLTTTIKSIDAGDILMTGVQITREFKEIPQSKELRAGENKNCSLSIQLNPETQKFKCSDNSRPQLIYCNNPDECNAWAVVDDYGIGRNCSDTFDTTACTSNGCVELLGSYTPAVIICRGRANNSIARRLQFVFSSKNASARRKLRLAREIVEDSETIRLEANETFIYVGQNVKLTCTAVGVFYSFGFQWGVERTKSILMVLGRNETQESFDDTTHSYISQTVISVNKAMLSNNSVLKVVCSGPRWNRVNWINATIHMDVNEPETPNILQHGHSTDTRFEGDQTDGNYHNFFCIANGKPVPQLYWEWNSNQLNDQVGGGQYRTVHHSNEQNGTINSTLLHSSNFYARTTHRFKLEPTQGSSSTNNLTLLLVIPLVVFLVTAVLASTAYILYCRSLKTGLTRQEIQNFMKGLSVDQAQIVPSAQDDYDYAQSHAFVLIQPYVENYEISPNRFKIDESKVLGKGHFGLVLQGFVDDTMVAVKTVRRNADKQHLKALLSELKIMIHIGNHENIVPLIGACTKDLKRGFVYVFVKYLDFGDLKSFLTQNKSYFDLELSQRTPGLLIPNSTAFGPLDLILWSSQIASGMEHLASRNVIHGDLAARNVLLDEFKVAKVTDFGLSRRLYDCSNYIKKQKEPLPWRWLALESLKHLTFSKQSDVWAYGVTVWEIFSLGEVPYPGYSWDMSFINELEHGLRMGQPKYGNEELFATLKECWQFEPSLRPSFEDLKTTFENMLNLNSSSTTSEAGFKSEELNTYEFEVHSPDSYYDLLHEHSPKSNETI